MKIASKSILFVCLFVLCLFYLHGCDRCSVDLSNYEWIPIYNDTKYQMVVIRDGDNAGYLEPAGLRKVCVEKGIKTNLRLRFVDDTGTVVDIRSYIDDNLIEIRVRKNEDSYVLTFLSK